MTHTPTTLASTREDYARRVVTDPAFAPFGEERRSAWATLMEARGLSHRLGPTRAPSTLCACLADAAARITTRVSARKAWLDQHGPEGAA